MKNLTGFSFASSMIVLSCLTFSGITRAEPIYLEQGWNEDVRQGYYFTPQGSRMIPAEWFMAIETVDGKEFFSSNANLEAHGFITVDQASTLNPYGLPIGFAIDPVIIPGRGNSLGFTCAACHNAELIVEGKPVRIDGAPANLDFDGFYADLASAIHRTFYDDAAFKEFANQVSPDASVEQITALKEVLVSYQSELAGDAVVRSAVLKSGFGRVDALTQSINALAVTALKEPANLRPVNAPTSYPHLWLAPHLEFVQWNPTATNPINRNGGEVLGVFGAVNLNEQGHSKYDSSLLIPELILLEHWLRDLQPPRWDEVIFGSINPELAEYGEALYMQHCDGCHTSQPYRRTDPADNDFGKSFIKIGRVNYKEAGTDRQYVESLLNRVVRAEKLTDDGLNIVSVVPALQYFSTTVGQVVAKAVTKATLDEQQSLELNGFRSGTGDSAPPSYTDLKAGPLAGIWATGPYLHNGSVPTLYELLSPESQRREIFWTGGRELDTVHMGIESGEAEGRFLFDTRLRGNHNIGHNYPAEGLDEEARMAIIEYLKTQ
ncbi:MAG: hypothetical protein ACI8P9_005719 [Parasphingorhabdus sp.]|jgi:hypothetical protein